MIKIRAEGKPLNLNNQPMIVASVLVLTIAPRTGKAAITAALNTSVMIFGGLFGSDLKI